jgi:CBS domain-containing protein
MALLGRPRLNFVKVAAALATPRGFLSPNAWSRRDCSGPAFIPTKCACTVADKTHDGRTSMKVSDVLKSNRQTLATCIPDESIVSISTRLSTLNIGAFPVCDANGKLVGIISERDVVRAFAKDGSRLAERHVRDLMVRDVVTCEQESTMVDAERLMHKHRIRHLPVVDRGALVGMLSIRDVMVWRWQESRDEVNVLRDAMIAVRNR